MENKQFIALIITVALIGIFIGLCIFYGLGGAYQLTPTEGAGILKVNKFSGEAYVYGVLSKNKHEIK